MITHHKLIMIRYRRACGGREKERERERECVCVCVLVTFLHGNARDRDLYGDGQQRRKFLTDRVPVTKPTDGGTRVSVWRS